MTVSGKFYPGLIVDPGASRGLIGTDTLSEFIRAVVRPAGLEHLIQWHASHHQFSGISATAEKSLGHVRVPIGLKGMHTLFFAADVLGGSASGCPDLVPLATFIAFRSIMIFDHYENGDGLLGLWNSKKGRYAAQRLSLTDSGHYLLHVDHFGREADAALATTMEKRAAELAQASRSLPARQSSALRRGHGHVALSESLFHWVQRTRRTLNCIVPADQQLIQARLLVLRLLRVGTQLVR